MALRKKVAAASAAAAAARAASAAAAEEDTKAPAGTSTATANSAEPTISVEAKRELYSLSLRPGVEPTEPKRQANHRRVRTTNFDIRPTSH